MKTSLFAAFILLLLVFGCRQQEEYDLAVTNITLFDSETKKTIYNKTILIISDTVTAIVDGDQKVAAKKVIDGKGRLVTPGLVDTHIHMTDVFGDYDAAPQYLASDSASFYRERLAKTHLAYGVTTVADMGQPEKWMSITMDWQNTPDPKYPNLFNCGSALISDEERVPYVSHAEVADSEEAERKVQEYYGKGVRHIKLYWRLREAEMKAAAEKARSLGMNIYAHIDNNIISINQALDMEVRHFEHASTVSNDVFQFQTHGDSLTELMQLHYPEVQAYMPFALEKIQYVEDNPDLRERRDQLIGKMIDAGASLSTTIHLFGSFCGRTYFDSSLESHYRDETPQLNQNQKKRLNAAFDTYMAYLKRAHDKGLALRIGTDGKEGGKAALSEMLLLAEAGFSMADTLQIATYNGARALNADKHLGSIKPGKKADLIIFDKDPFKDYKNLLSEKTIVKGGMVYLKQ